jgi:hypothetical protein
VVNELIGLLAGLGPLTVQKETVDFIICQENLTAQRAARLVKQIFHVKRVPIID